MSETPRSPREAKRRAEGLASEEQVAGTSHAEIYNTLNDAAKEDEIRGIILRSGRLGLLGYGICPKSRSANLCRMCRGQVLREGKACEEAASLDDAGGDRAGETLRDDRGCSRRTLGHNNHAGDP